MKKFLAVTVLFGFGLLMAGTQLSAAPTAVGADKCAKMCHKVEYQSWLETKHAKAEKKTDCETCHGPGSDYMKLAIMKDPEKAKAAGLIAKPDVASCAASSCHKAGEIKPDMLAKVHAHKPKA